MVQIIAEQQQRKLVHNFLPNLWNAGMVRHFTRCLESKRASRYKKESFDGFKGLLTLKRMNEVVCERIVQMRLSKLFALMRWTLE